MSHQWRIVVLAIAVVGGASCASTGSRQAPDPLQLYNPGAAGSGGVSSTLAMYRRMGLSASAPPISFVANVGTFATTAPESTFVIPSIAIPNRGLTFVRNPDGQGYLATYDVTIVVRSRGTEVQRISGHEAVNVPTFKETSRTDESIIFRHVMTLPPGRYAVTYTVSDSGSTRSNAEEGVIDVPRYTSGMVSRPVVVYEATPRTTLDSAPQYLASPSASKTFGIDSVASVYVEAYGAASNAPLFMQLSDEHGHVMWSDRVQLTSRAQNTAENTAASGAAGAVASSAFASGIVTVPLLHADVGITLLTVDPNAPGNPSGSTTERAPTDTTAAVPAVPVASAISARAMQAPLFLGLGPDLPVVSFDEMVSYLRFFTTPDRLRALRNAPPESRGVAWAEFLKSASGNGRDNSALQDYLERIRDANIRYRGDATEGWLSDRGSVFVGLGDPDATYEEQAYGTYTMNPNSRSKYLIWDYHDLQSRIVFVDEYGIGQWRLLQSSASLFRSLLGRVAH